MLRLVKGRDSCSYVDCKSEIPKLVFRQRRLNMFRNRLFRKLTVPYHCDDLKFEKATNQGITVLKARTRWENSRLKR